MGKKIFVSYKYADSNVRQFSDLSNWGRKQDTARSYVDLLVNYIKEHEHRFKGEEDGEDLSGLTESTIQDKLFDRIYDSTMTIVLLSPAMRDTTKTESQQWIPREVSYSLREQSRKNSNGKSITSGTNALLAIVLPDRNESYGYYIGQCSSCGDEICTTQNISWLFPILRKNTFNIRQPDSKSCTSYGSTVYHGDPSYIAYVKWDDFIKDPEKYINKAYDLQARKSEYEIHVTLE